MRKIRSSIVTLAMGLLIGACGVVILSPEAQVPKKAKAVEVLEQGVSIPVINDIDIEASQKIEIGNSVVNTGRYNLVYRFYDVDNHTNGVPVLVYESGKIEAGSTEELRLSQYYNDGVHNAKVIVIPYTVEGDKENDSVAEYNININLR